MIKARIALQHTSRIFGKLSECAHLSNFHRLYHRPSVTQILLTSQEHFISILFSEYHISERRDTTMRKRKFLLRMIALTLMIMLSFSYATPVLAATGYASVGSPSSGCICEINTTSTISTVKPYTATQAEHRQGRSTNIGISYTVTNTTTSSREFSSFVQGTYLVVTVQAAAKAGVSESASHSIGASVTYTIPANTPDGRYRIEAVFPQDRVSFVVSEYNTSGTRVVKTAVIDRMPRPEDAYHRLVRYADAING